MKLIEKYPKLAGRIERMLEERWLEILDDLRENDTEYMKITDKRSECSTALLAVSETEIFENYSDSIYAQQIYELEKVYEVALEDALDLLTGGVPCCEFSEDIL